MLATMDFEIMDLLDSLNDMVMNTVTVTVSLSVNRPLAFNAEALIQHLSRLNADLMSFINIIRASVV